MLSPSKHYIQYDAVTYLEKGFTVIAGNVRHLSKKPRYWRINVSLTLESGSSFTVIPFSFNSTVKLKLAEVGKTVNQEIPKHITHTQKCASCIVTAYILTEGGK